MASGKPGDAGEHVIAPPPVTGEQLPPGDSQAPTEAPLRQRAMRGGIYLAGRQGLAVCLKLMGVLLITRLLGPSQYGAFVSAQNIYQYALLLGQAGVGVYLLRYPGIVPERAWRTCYGLLLGQALLLTLGLELSRGLFDHWTGVEGYATVMVAMAFAMPFQLLAVPATIKLERELDYRGVAIIEIGGDVAYYAIAAPMVLAGVGPVSLGIAMVIKQVLFFALGLRLSRSRFRIGFDRATAGEVIRYASTFSFANWIWQLRMLVNPLIVGPTLGAGAVGIVGMTVGLLEMLSIIKTIIWRLSVAVLARVQEDHARLRTAITEGMELQTLAVGATLLGFGWVGQFIVPVVFGARWAPVMDLYPFVAISYLSVSMFNVHSAVLSVISRNRDLGIYHIVHIILFAGSAWFAVRAFGIAGYGYAELAALPAYLVMHLVLARAIGSPRYGIALLWWAAAVVGLCWKELGLWAILVPFVALALPMSLRRLKIYFELVMKMRGGKKVVAA